MALTKLIDEQTISATNGSNRTFGNKLRTGVKLRPSLKAYLELIPLRNLLAHAKFEIVQIGTANRVAMITADLDSAMNARLVSEDEWDSALDTWQKAISAALKDVIGNQV